MSTHSGVRARISQNARGSQKELDVFTTPSFLKRVMKTTMKAIALLLLGMSIPLFAQTGTFTATGYGTCQNSDVTSQPLYCTVQLSQNGVRQGYLTFYLQ